MQVILLEKMRNLGVLGDTVKVKAGYARNFLIPQGKAVYANQNNIEKFEQRRAELEKVAAEKHAKAVARQQKITQIGTVTVNAKAGEEGKLFGSITTRDVADALNAAGADVEKREINLSEAIRHVGEYEIDVELESDVIANIKLNVAASA